MLKWKRVGAFDRRDTQEADRNAFFDAFFEAFPEYSGKDFMAFGPEQNSWRADWFRDHPGSLADGYEHTIEEIASWRLPSEYHITREPSNFWIGYYVFKVVDKRLFGILTAGQDIWEITKGSKEAIERVISLVDATENGDFEEALQQYWTSATTVSNGLHLNFNA